MKVQFGGYEFEPCPGLDRKFFKYHMLNQHVFAEMVRYAVQMKDAGCSRGSVYLIVQRIRWDRFIQTRGTDLFKISNDYTPFYSRLIGLLYPDLTLFFNKKAMRIPTCFDIDGAIRKITDDEE